ncbi:MAG TPA: ABC transporter permease [Candidatus Eisenbergiella stercorigallinarum]|uniref:ABC transporter permease n=1 Tax=Candidatus Eisenbergiella stercorigallinarum TaxID=2838557 RepID=A0A9D2R0P3_9FIRM|nr:ABC transporter permease [Candidatus Eisenbergiella stercorigallinarum]
MPNIGIIRQSVQLSWENIRSNKMRTLLTTLGIIIGVTAVISLITIVNGAISTVMDEFSSLGAGTLSVSITGTPLKSGLTENDLESLGELDNVAGLSPTISATGMAARNQDLLDAVSIQGKSEVYYEYNDLVTVGRPINRTDVEDQAYVCVIDQDIAENLFAGENPVGKTLTLNGATYTVIGLEGENSDLMASMSGFGTSSDGTVTIPYTTARKITGQKNISSLEIYIENTDYTDRLSDEVEGVLYQAFNQNEDSYYVFAMDSLLDTMNEMMSMLTYMLAGIASIALLVGGIGIMNMMLVSVSERKQEIGLRKAMGATPGRIQMQFLLESVVLSLIGGIIGVILGLLISVAAAALMETDFVFSVSAVALGVGFSTAVGIIFGWAPARKASRLSPIDALKSE